MHFRWVPGDGRRERLYVRRPGGSDCALRTIVEPRRCESSLVALRVRDESAAPSSAAAGDSGRYRRATGRRSEESLKGPAFPDGAPDRIRTCDLPLRRRTLYPAELPGLGELRHLPRWWSRWESNPRPQHCERCALPTELRPRQGAGSLPASVSARQRRPPRVDRRADSIGRARTAVPSDSRLPRVTRADYDAAYPVPATDLHDPLPLLRWIRR